MRRSQILNLINRFFHSFDRVNQEQLVYAALCLSVLAFLFALAALLKTSRRSASYELKLLREKFQELSIGVGDLSAKVLAMTANGTREVRAVEEKLEALKEQVEGKIISRELEFDSPERLENRVNRLEEIVKAKMPSAPNLAHHADWEKGGPVRLELSLEGSPGEEPRTLRQLLEDERIGFQSELVKMLPYFSTDRIRWHELFERLLLEHRFGRLVTDSFLDAVDKAFPDDNRMDIDGLLGTLRVAAEKVLDVPGPEVPTSDLTFGQPTVFILAGATGMHKLSGVGGLVRCFKEEGKRVLLGACDTGDEEAVKILDTWGRFADVQVVTATEDGRPTRVAYRSVHRAQDESFDVLLIDACGEISAKPKLITELCDVVRIVDREQPGAQHQVLLLADLLKPEQASHSIRAVSAALPLSGLLLSGLKAPYAAGMAMAFVASLGVPIRYVSLCDSDQGVKAFTASDFIHALLGQ